VPSNFAFVTSQTFSTTALATLGAGTGADAVLRGADKACAQAAAASGALVPAGTYVAWISSRSQDALARLAAAHAGVAPRGWSRVDGRPFVDQIPAGNLAHIYYPLAVTELGGAPPHVWVWTATDATAAHVSTSDCMNWASAATSDYSVVGIPTAGGSNWTGGVAGTCDNALPLYCLQVDHATPVTVPAAPANAKRVFMTSGFSPSTGLAGADAACATDAQHAGLSGTFRAALATTTASAASRFHPTGTRAFVRLDGVVVATVDSDLFQASPKMLAPINVDTSGNFSGGSVYFGATGITQVGTNTCSDWTDASAASMVTLGTANYTGTGAFYGFSDACTRVSVIYCLED